MGVASGRSNSVYALYVYMPAALRVRVCLCECEEQLKNNSSKQVFRANDHSLLSIKLLTTSCRGRNRQSQTLPRQTDG